MPTAETLLEVFRFISVKDSVNGLLPTNLPSNFLVFENIYTEIITAEPDIDNDTTMIDYNDDTIAVVNYYKIFRTAVEDNEASSVLTNVWMSFKGPQGPDYLKNSKTLYELFPNFDKIDHYINSEYDTVDGNAAISTLMGILGTSALSFKAAENRWFYYFWVWESLISHIAAPDEGDQRFREQLVSVIKIWELMDAWDGMYPSDTPLKDVMPWYNLYVVLPKGMPIAQEYTSTISTNDPPATTDNTTLLANIETYKAAIKKLNKTLKKQLGEYKNAQQDLTVTVVDPADPFSPVTNSPFLLSPGNITVLGSEVVDILTANGMDADYIDVAHGMAYFANELQEMYGQLITAHNSMTCVINGGLVVNSNFCASPIPVNPCATESFPDLDISSIFIKNYGVGDLLLVNKKLKRYEASEVARIENVLKSETKEFTERDYERIEDLLENETIDTKSTSFEQQVSNTVSSGNSASSSSNNTPAYGPTVQTTPTTGQGSSKSTNTAATNAGTFARNTTSKASSSVTKSVRELRRTLTVTEHERTTKHSFVNSSDENISGIYRFLDMVYDCQLVNYGKRLMLEFMVPEPAAFYIYSQINKGTPETTIVKPLRLDELGVTDFNSINEYNYASIAAAYGVTDIEPPPPMFDFMAYAKNKSPESPAKKYQTESAVLPIPTGYHVVSAEVFGGCEWGSPPTDPAYMTFSFGKYSICVNSSTKQGGSHLAFGEDSFKTELPISFWCFNTDLYYVSINITLQRNEETYKKWAIKTFAAIVDGYNQRKKEYEDKLSDMQDNQQGFQFENFGQGSNRNRQIEHNELKRRCIEFMTGQRFESFHSMSDRNNTYGYPEITFELAQTEGAVIKYFEDAVEWENMTYQFYPYYWGKKKYWVEKINYEDNDPLFTNFIQAGAAKVMLPINVAFTESMLHFIQTSEIWNGQNIPVTGKVAMLVDEVKSADTAEPYTMGGTWEVRIPTEHLILNSDELDSLNDSLS